VAQAIGTLTFQITAPAPAPPPPAPAPPGVMSSVSVSANLSSPQTTGTTVTFTGGGSGGTTPYSYKWWIQRDGGVWSMLQDWNTGGTLNWTPSQPGIYVIGAWGRSAGATADTPQAIGTTPFVISVGAPAPPPPPAPVPSPAGSMSSVAVTGNMSSPRAIGIAVTFTASGSGGTAPYAYKWWLQKDGGSWTMVQDWSTNALTWTPTQQGSYVIGAWGRSTGSSLNIAEAIGTVTFVVTGAGTPGAPMTGASLVLNSGVPQAGQSMTLTASGTGGAPPYSFKWWVQRDGGAWVLLQEWSTSSTLTWTPPLPGTYVFGVWGRSADATADVAQAIGTVTARVF
jgi:hypothetical protein